MLLWKLFLIKLDVFRPTGSYRRRWAPIRSSRAAYAMKSVLQPSHSR